MCLKIAGMGWAQTLARRAPWVASLSSPSASVSQQSSNLFGKQTRLLSWVSWGPGVSAILFSYPGHWIGSQGWRGLHFPHSLLWVFKLMVDFWTKVREKHLCFVFLLNLVLLFGSLQNLSVIIIIFRAGPVLLFYRVRRVLLTDTECLIRPWHIIEILWLLCYLSNIHQHVFLEHEWLSQDVQYKSTQRRYRDRSPVLVSVSVSVVVLEVGLGLNTAF